MNALRAENPVKKMDDIKSLAESGKTRKEIAQELGYKGVDGLNAFVSRYGHKWDDKRNIYIVKDEKQEEPEEDIQDSSPDKVRRIISMLSEKIDGKEIAKILKFRNHQDMADYMKSLGYIWDCNKNNYIKAVMIKEKTVESQKKIKDNAPSCTEGKCDCMSKYGDILKLLDENKNKLPGMLKSFNTEEECIPRYTLQGYNIGKSLSIVSSLDNLIKDYSKDKNIPQKQIIEVAIVEFLKKYGYSNQVKEMLHV
jgi:hypothetical protein